MPIESEPACLEFFARVRKRRHTRATLMNEASDGHDGSSRSHCAIILTLHQLDRATGAEVGVFENQWPGCNLRGLCVAQSMADNYVVKFPEGAPPEASWWADCEKSRP